MRIVHISDLHFTSPRARRNAIMRRAPGAVLGTMAVAGYLGASVATRTRPNAKTVKALLGLAGLSYAYTIRPLINHLHDLAAARDRLLDHLAGERPDRIVVTGDFSTLADDEELNEAATFVRKLEAIAGEGRVLIAPGNHDAPIPYGPNPLRSSKTERKLRDYLRHFGAFHDAPHLFPTIRLDPVSETCFIAFDSVEPSYPLNSAGRIPAEQLDRATDALEKPEGRASMKILLLHHHFTDPANASFFSSENRVITGPLADPEKLMAWAADMKIVAILCGHDHRMYEVLGAIPVYCAGSTPKLIHEGAEASYRVFEVRGGAIKAEPRKME